MVSFIRNGFYRECEMGAFLFYQAYYAGHSINMVWHGIIAFNISPKPNFNYHIVSVDYARYIIYNFQIQYDLGFYIISIRTWFF